MAGKARGGFGRLFRPGSRYAEVHLFFSGRKIRAFLRRPPPFLGWSGDAHLRFWLALLLSLATVGVFAQEKPPAAAPQAARQEQKLSDAPRVVVREFRFEGNTVFTGAELADVVASYLNRPIQTEDLEEARRALTLHYVNRGYINSGALLEDQPVADGIITFRIVEGRLDEVQVEGNRWLRDSYIRPRIRRGAGPPLNMRSLSQELLLLKENPTIKSVNAELRPGPERGSSLLDVKVTEELPFRLGFQVRNDRPPSVGAELFELLAAHQSVLGYSDALSLQYGILQRSDNGAEFSELDNLAVSYAVPVTPRDTTLQLFYSRNNYAVIEEPFDQLDITSESTTYGVSIRQPVFKSTRRQINLGLSGERRQSKTFLFDEPFSFSPGAVEGESTVSVLRLVAEWIERSQKQVIAFRSTASVGVDVLDSTDNGTSRDGKFFSWQSQGQYVRRLFGTSAELILSATGQWANDPLLSLEQFSIGGLNTVRGYRENQIVRDTGVVGSAEVRVPIFKGRAGNPILQIAPFFDYGIGWNVDSPTPDPSDIASAGLGLLFAPTKKIQGRIYWGYAFRDFDTDDEDLQDHGIHFKLSAFIF